MKHESTGKEPEQAMKETFELIKTPKNVYKIENYMFQKLYRPT